MKIEVLDFYPKVNTDAGYITGDIKIRLPDLKINILGIYVCRQKNGYWLILMPCRSAINAEGQKTKFPIIHFDEADHKALMNVLYQMVPLYLKQRLKDTENPLVFPIYKPGSSISQQASPLKAPPSEQNQITKSKLHLKARSAPAKPKVFVDLPPKPAATKKTIFEVT